MVGGHVPASGKPTPDFQPGDAADPFRWTRQRYAGVPTDQIPADAPPLTVDFSGHGPGRIIPPQGGSGTVPVRSAPPVLSEIPRGVEIPRADLDPRKYLDFGTGRCDMPEVVPLVAEHPGSDHSAPGGPAPDAGKPPPPPADDQGDAGNDPEGFTSAPCYGPRTFKKGYGEGRPADDGFGEAVAREYERAASTPWYGRPGRLRPVGLIPPPRGWSGWVFLVATLDNPGGPETFLSVGRVQLPSSMRILPPSLVVGNRYYALELTGGPRFHYCEVLAVPGRRFEPQPGEREKADGSRGRPSWVRIGLELISNTEPAARCPCLKWAGAAGGRPPFSCGSSQATYAGAALSLPELQLWCLSEYSRCIYYPDDFDG